jgi:hypothetical protein
VALATPFRRVVQNVCDRSFECGRISSHHPGRELHIEAEPGCASFDPIDRPLADLREIQLLDLRGRRVVPGKLDEVLHEDGELLALGTNIGKEFLAVFVGQPALGRALDEEIVL